LLCGNVGYYFVFFYVIGFLMSIFGRFFIFVILMFYSVSIFAIFSVTKSGPFVQLNELKELKCIKVDDCKICVVSGTITSLDSIVITASQFMGTAKISAPLIIIRTDDFKFKGKIRCNGHCIIYSSKPIDICEIDFKGNGDLVVVIELFTS